MILLDTNVMAELMREAPAPVVVEWLDAQPEGDVWISAVTVAEIRLGIGLLTNGRRKSRLGEVADEMFEEEFGDNCLPFDCAASSAYADIVARRARMGRPIGVEDAQIAAIARTSDLTLATRNTKDFDGIDGLKVVNPWEG